MRVDGRRIAPAAAAALAVLALLVVAGASRTDAATSATTKRAEVTPVTKTVLLVGDSIPTIFADDFARVAAGYGYDVVRATKPGCPATGVGKVLSSGKRFRRNGCPLVLGAQNRDVETYRPALVIWWSRYELAPRLGPDGKVLPLGSKAWQREQEASFAERARALTRLGAHLVAVQIEPPGPALAVRNPAEKYFLVGQTLLHRWDVVRAWNAFLASHKGPSVFSISVSRLVCHDRRVPCNDALPDGQSARPDGVHYSETAQRLLAPRILDAAFRAARLTP